MIREFDMSIFLFFLVITAILPEVFDNDFLSHYLTNPYTMRTLKIWPDLRD